MADNKLSHILPSQGALLSERLWRKRGLHDIWVVPFHSLCWFVGVYGKELLSLATVAALVKEKLPPEQNIILLTLTALVFLLFRTRKDNF